MSDVERMHRIAVEALAALENAQHTLALLAGDTLQLAGLVEPHDEAEAEVLRGIVSRARSVLGPEARH